MGTSIPIAIYRVEAAKAEYYPNLLDLSQVAMMLPGFLSTIFTLVPNAPSMDNIGALEAILSDSAGQMVTGEIGCIEIVFRVGEGMGSVGFHRMPVAADKGDEHVVRIIGIDTAGNIHTGDVDSTSGGRLRAFMDRGRHRAH